MALRVRVGRAGSDAWWWWSGGGPVYASCVEEYAESMLLWLSNRVLVGCEGGEPLVVSGGELMVVVDASLEL